MFWTLLQMSISAFLIYVMLSTDKYTVGHNIDMCRMQDGKMAELSDFEKCVIIRHHRNGQSSEQNYHKSIVSYMTQKCKVSGNCRNKSRVGSSMKLGERDRRLLFREILKNLTQPM